MFLKPCFYMFILHSQVVERLVSEIIKLYHLTIGLLPHPWSNFMIQWLILIFRRILICKYSRTRLRRTRLGNNKKYVLTEVRLIRVHK